MFILQQTKSGIWKDNFLIICHYFNINIANQKEKYNITETNLH